MRLKDLIDISTEDKRQEIRILFSNFKSKADIYKYYGVSDNSYNVKYINFIAREIGFDFSTIKKSYIRTCKFCGKMLNKSQKVFCSQSCSAKYNNKFISRKTKESRTCVVCGKDFMCSVHVKKCNSVCDDCKKHNRPHNKEAKFILDYSKRTVTKILKRSGHGCEICGWNDETCDIHHITPVSKGGTNEHDNLIIVCPNCHRKCHNNRFSEDFLRSKSIKNTFKDWKTYYNNFAK